VTRCGPQTACVTVDNTGYWFVGCAGPPCHTPAVGAARPGRIRPGLKTNSRVLIAGKPGRRGKPPPHYGGSQVLRVAQRVRQLRHQAEQVDGGHAEVVGIAAAPFKRVNGSRDVREQSPRVLKLKPEGAVEDFDRGSEESYRGAEESLSYSQCIVNARTSYFATLRNGQVHDTTTCGSAL